MAYDQQTHNRRSLRLPTYDYTSSGAYFVTICVRGGKCLLGEVVDGKTKLSAWGQIVHDEWLASPKIRRELTLDAVAVMPSQVHVVVWIAAADGACAGGAESRGDGLPKPGTQDVGAGAHRRAAWQEQESIAKMKGQRL
jgi:putative transposase